MDSKETTSAELFHVGGSIIPPRAMYSPQPEFTEQARKANHDGTCTLGLIVEEDGHPTHVRVLKAVGMGLDENAIKAVQTWKFEPAMKDGHPVPEVVPDEANDGWFGYCEAGVSSPRRRLQMQGGVAETAETS